MEFPYVHIRCGQLIYISVATPDCFTTVLSKDVILLPFIRCLLFVRVRFVLSPCCVVYFLVSFLVLLPSERERERERES